jgi:ATP-dependent DNA ligase
MKQGEAVNFAFIEPIKALPVSDLPVGDWRYELKFDGYRALVFKAGKEVRLVSRNPKNLQQRLSTTYLQPETADCQECDHRRRNHRARPEREIFFPASSILRAG